MNTKEVLAQYDEKCIRVYQAYNGTIAQEAVEGQKFGRNFSLSRMTWIKPSFLWMMYRSGWGTKLNQEYILALDIYREKFDELLKKAVLTSFKSSSYSEERWKKAIAETDVRCQWDPDKDIYGNNLNYRAIQIGIKGDTLKDFVNTGILRIEDITPKVKKWKEEIEQKNFNIMELPQEKLYEVKNEEVRRRLNME